MRTAWAALKGAACVVVGLFVVWIAFTFGWIPYASDTPAERRNTKAFFGIMFSLLAVFFAIQREWQTAAAMVGLAAAFVAVFLLVDLWIDRTNAAERTRENRRRAAMRRRIAESKDAI